LEVVVNTGLAFVLFDPRPHPHEPDFPRVERRGEPGGRYPDMAVTGAAGLDDRYEARMIDPDMTPEQALARLGEAG
jgi:hypothetical protein